MEEAAATPLPLDARSRDEFFSRRPGCSDLRHAAAIGPRFGGKIPVGYRLFYEKTTYEDCKLFQLRDLLYRCGRFRAKQRKLHLFYDREQLCGLHT